MTKILEQPVDRFPLAWPAGWPRTPAINRQRAPFHRLGTRTITPQGGAAYDVKEKRDITLAGAIEQLMRECDRLGAQGPVLSTNVELRMDGQPKGGRAEPGDPGVALYFRHKNRPIVLACDKWSRVPDNVSAIARHIEAIRAQDRWGVGRLEQALAGYQRLLSGRRAWWEVLGFSRPPVQWSLIEEARERLVKQYHPDRPEGNLEKMTEINEAFQTAKEEFGR